MSCFTVTGIRSGKALQNVRIKEANVCALGLQAQQTQQTETEGLAFLSPRMSRLGVVPLGGVALCDSVTESRFASKEEDLRYSITF